MPCSIAVRRHWGLQPDDSMSVLSVPDSMQWFKHLMAVVRQRIFTLVCGKHIDLSINMHAESI